MMESDAQLLAAAREVTRPRRLSSSVEVASVGSALRTSNGRIFTGVCIDAACGIGFCAEHGAIAAMITAGESRIEAIVAVNEDAEILSPCGRCRELVIQVDHANADTRVLLAKGARKMRDLVPDHWLLDL
jgi:cytidine deaminase